MPYYFVFNSLIEGDSGAGWYVEAYLGRGYGWNGLYYTSNIPGDRYYPSNAISNVSNAVGGNIGDFL